MATEPKTKKQLRIEAAELLMLEYAEDEGSEDIINDLKYRSHVAKVCEALGLDNGLGFLADAVDKRVACGLKPLDVIKLALAGTLVRDCERSRTEIAEATFANIEAARLEKIKRDQAGPRPDRRNGPVQR